MIQQDLKIPIAYALVQEELRDGDTARVELKDGKIIVIPVVQGQVVWRKLRGANRLKDNRVLVAMECTKARRHSMNDGIQRLLVLPKADTPRAQQIYCSMAETLAFKSRRALGV